VAVQVRDAPGRGDHIAPVCWRPRHGRASGVRHAHRVSRGQIATWTLGGFQAICPVCHPATQMRLVCRQHREANPPLTPWCVRFRVGRPPGRSEMGVLGDNRAFRPLASVCEGSRLFLGSSATSTNPRRLRAPRPSSHPEGFGAPRGRRPPDLTPTEAARHDGLEETAVWPASLTYG
jgi:hypothetical protein